MKPSRIVFMGSPDFALPSLRSLAEKYPIVGVVTQPDRPAGRGKTLTPPPIKLLAEQLQLPIIQPERLRAPEAVRQLIEWQPDVIVVAAFGQILKPEVLDLPKHGCINVHASLLPRWRGAAPIPAAIAHGDSVTGITIMCMDPGIDTGPWLTQKTEPILPIDTTESLGKRLAELGARLLLESLPLFLDGQVAPIQQNHDLATYAPILKKEDGLLDISLSAEVLARKIRAYFPWPGTYWTWQDRPLKIHQARAMEGSLVELNGLAPGDRLRFEGFPAIATANGVLVLEIVQPSGKKSMAGNVFLQGARGWN